MWRWSFSSSLQPIGKCPANFESLLVVLRSKPRPVASKLESLPNTTVASWTWMAIKYFRLGQKTARVESVADLAKRSKKDKRATRQRKQGAQVASAKLFLAAS